MKSVSLPSTLTTLGEAAFFSCTKLQGIAIPKGVKVISNSAFAWCNDLCELTLPDGLTRICKDAFLECRSISVVVIPLSVEVIEASAFSGTYGTKICARVEAEPNAWESHWDKHVNAIVWNFKELYTDSQNVTYALRNDGTAMVFDGRSAENEIVLAVENYVINEIGPNAFEGHNGNMISIQIPKTVTVIGSYAFSYCWDLSVICFDGTLAEWNAIEKGERWNNFSIEKCMVYCSDATVKATDSLT